jgi:L-histidine N-alpha-methyltransferase
MSSTGDINEFASSIAKGLSGDPRRLDSRWLYDDRGSHIFEKICDQPEYYLTRAEAEILSRRGADIAQLTGPVKIIEFGCGNAVKTQILLEAYTDCYGQVEFAPVDISRAALEQAHARISSGHPAVIVEPFCGHYEEAFQLCRSEKPVMLLFLGSSVGNFDISESAAFWEDIADHLRPKHFCLLGIDITHDEQALYAAYNDAAGHSAAFTRNLFKRMNRELGSRIDLEAIEHVARYNPDRRQVEIFAEFTKAQRMRIALLDQVFAIAEGETIRTEISRKFDLKNIEPYLENFGFKREKVYCDESNRFAVLLLRRL